MENPDGELKIISAYTISSSVEGFIAAGVNKKMQFYVKKTGDFDNEAGEEEKINKEQKTEFLKIVYFDEDAAQDYVDVTNGGRLDWTTEENKQKVAKIVAEIEAQAKSGFNILNYIKATFQGKVDASAAADLTSAFDKTIKNTLLTDYIQAAYEDSHVKKFENSGVYAPENSVTLYKMVSSYMTIVPKEEMPIDMEKLNEAILGEQSHT